MKILSHVNVRRKRKKERKKKGIKNAQRCHISHFYRPFSNDTMAVRWLTPSLPEPVKFSGSKMHGRAYKQYIFWSYNMSTFNAMRFKENPFTHQCDKEDKRA